MTLYKSEKADPTVPKLTVAELPPIIIDWIMLASEAVTAQI